MSPAPLTQGLPNSEPGVATSAPAQSVGLGAKAWNWLLETQSSLNRDMAGAVRRLKSDNPLAAAAALIAIAFAYGVLHAAGPGHGKAVISSYVLSNEETVRRGVALSFLAALFQALSAIVFVGILAIVLRQTSIQMRATEATIETISWALVAAVGAFLLWRQIAALRPRRAATDGAHAGGPPRHHHAHAGHDHGPDCGCGHAHMPSPEELQGAWSWKRALPLALSVGIRPCSGAILLLIFALSQGMLWAGVLGTFAMALGTAITVSVLAAIAVGSRNWAERASGPAGVWAGRIHAAAGVAGAALVFGLGSAFFLASLNGAAPF
ncbi:MAG: nickel/cobalt transporter [Hyphomicrobium sp.]